MSDEAVLVDVVDGVATLTLNRPDMRNPLTQDVSAGLIDALEDLKDGDARCLVVEGAGEAFCAGGDVNAMMERMAGEWPLHEAVEHVRQETGRAVRTVAEFPLPTVAKIGGVAFGAGGALALACDVRLMHEDARISFGFRNVGLAVDAGTSYLLSRAVGLNVAKELVYTGERVEAERARELGLVNHVYPDEAFDERVEEFVAEVADGPTVALRESKQLIEQGPDSSLRQAITNEAAAQAAVFESDDHAEGVEAFMEKREPEFDGT